MNFDSFDHPTIEHLQGFLYATACVNQQLNPQEDINYQYYLFELTKDNNSTPKEVLVQFIGEHIKDISEYELQLLDRSSRLTEIIHHWKPHVKSGTSLYFAAKVAQDERGADYTCDRFIHLLDQFLNVKSDFNVFEFQMDMKNIPYNFYYQWGMDFKSYLFIVGNRMYYLHFATALG
jgi:hypothetical protein